ncbi:leucine-rich repeat domain-containing protein, partial [Ruminococcus flavefaciens]|uniref:leucine-rich repeat domain-containing protein n=1 Tax=Ruminococcus flavefaciens TaxID=1265 RepID=UPI0005651A0B
IVVSFINDETSENVLSVETTVSEGELVNSELKADASKLPQYYLVKAQLFDSLNRPVGKSYTLSRYTKEFQEILATDINDFEQEQVVNLDEDETTNFLVLNEDTVKAESSEEQNTLVSANYDNNVFVFENADESITSLENGEYLYIQPDEDNIIAVNVEKIEKDGDTVTVSGNDDIEDMFDFIKIESEGNISKAQIDTSAADDGVSFPNVDENGDVIVDDDGTFDFEYVEPQHDINFEFSSSKTISLDGSALINNKDSESDDPRPNDPYEDTEVSTNVKLSGSITFSVNFNFYKTLSTTKIECVIKITPSISFSGGFSIYNYTDKDSLPSVRSLAAKIAEIIIPTSIPLADLVISPRIFFELSGKINLSLKWVNIIGFAYNDGVFTDKTELFNEKNIKAGFSLEGELYTGLELQIYAEVINKKTASFGLDIKAGLRVKAEADLSGLIKSNKPQDNVIISVDKGDSYHACSFCVKFTTDFVIKCNLELYIIGKKKEWNLLEISVKLPFLNGYISAENGCGFGECNYKRYRVKFHDLTGSESDYLPAVITIGDKKARVTSKDTIFYCLPGSYSYDVSYNGESLKSGSITVSNSEIYIPYIQGPEHSEIVTGVPYIPEEIPKHEMEDLSLPALSFEKDEIISETGALGDHISYMLYPDGYLYACGYGEMYDFISSPFRDPSIVKYAVIENTGDEKDGGIITSIGNNVFVNCSNMESINLPTTIDRIGVNAFANCSLFSKVSYDEYDYEKEKVIEVRYPEGHLEMPKAVTTVEAGAFSGCSSFTDINIPETVIGIGSYAFSGCTGITSVEVPATVNKIGEFVFNDCSALEEAIIKGGADGIGLHIFSGCKSLA